MQPLLTYLPSILIFNEPPIVATDADRSANAAVDGHVAAASTGTETTIATDAATNTESLDVVTGVGAATDTAPPDREGRWIDRWAPERNTGELGVFTGVYAPGRRHELFQADEALPDQGFRSFNAAAPEIGARVGYYPLRFLGLEAEGGAMPTQAGDRRATLWNFRGSLIAQVPRWSVAPFAALGAGALGVASSREAVGNDVDPSLHFGGGLKIYLQRYTALRLDVRDVVSHRRGLNNGFENHNFEALLGFSVTLGRKRPSPLPEPAPAEPPPPKDTDGDGVIDPDDRCVDVPGVVEYEGCPIPDGDGDGFLDPDDACPAEAGVAPDGCPIRDTDGDGIMDPDDKCVSEPETVNGFEDADGCPDELPPEIQKFTGVIEGIYFDTGKATIRPASRKTLDAAVEVLQKFPDIRVKITGHTDTKGQRDFNLDLSQRRSDAVKQYLVDRGVAADRIETRGAGPDEPIADNKTSKGRAVNRRIEFNVINPGAGN